MFIQASDELPNEQHVLVLDDKKTKAEWRLLVVSKWANIPFLLHKTVCGCREVGSDDAYTAV